MLKSIDGSLQFVDFIFVDTFYEPIWLHHVDSFPKIAVQKYCLDIQYPNLTIHMSCNEYEDSYRFIHRNKWKGLIVIAFPLGITLATNLTLKVSNFSFIPLFHL